MHRSTPVASNARPGQFVVICGGVFCLTASVLSLQLIEMRLLSFMLWHHLAYMVISVVLLGLGAAGAVTAARSEWTLKHHAVLASASAGMTGLTTLAAFALVTRVELDTFQLTQGQIVTLLLYYGLLVVPYFFAGVSLSLVFTTGIQRIGTLYGVDLVGSAAGCYLSFLILEPLGAPTALVFCAALAAFGGLLLALGFGRPGWRTLSIPLGCLVSVG